MCFTFDLEDLNAQLAFTSFNDTRQINVKKLETRLLSCFIAVHMVMDWTLWDPSSPLKLNVFRVDVISQTDQRQTDPRLSLTRASSALLRPEDVICLWQPSSI